MSASACISVWLVLVVLVRVFALLRVAALLQRLKRRLGARLLHQQIDVVAIVGVVLRAKMRARFGAAAEVRSLIL